MTTKAQLNKKAFNIFKQIVLERDNFLCQSCGGKASTAHHYFPKSLYLYLYYELLNGFAICVSCHFAHHTKSDAIVHRNIEKAKGKYWFSKLEKKMKDKPAKYGSEKWIKENIERLDKIL
jgi:5-methylcytosine-specific restriction endonuclease McrA